MNKFKVKFVCNSYQITEIIPAKSNKAAIMDFLSRHNFDIIEEYAIFCMKL